MSLYNLGNARSPEQRHEMEGLEQAGVCVFCPQYSDPMWASEHWAVIRNLFPYAGTRFHLLLVPHEHITDMSTLSPPAREGFWDALDEVRRSHGLGFYGLAVRNGDTRYTGGTIAHLHFHILVGDLGDVPVRMKFSTVQ